jgi:hypothetical protein
MWGRANAICHLGATPTEIGCREAAVATERPSIPEGLFDVVMDGI